MAVWVPGKVTPTAGPKAPKIRKPGAPLIMPAPKAPAARAVGQFLPGTQQATPGGAAAPQPYLFPNGTAPWAPTVAPAGATPDPANFNTAQDSAYNNALASLLAGKNQGDQTIDTAARRGAEDKDRNLTLLGEGRTKAKTSETQSANKSGLLYSGILGKRLGDVDTDYSRREGDVNTAFARDEETRAGQRAALESTFNAGQRDAYQAAWERYIGAAQPTETASTSPLDDLLAKLAAAQTATRRS